MFLIRLLIVGETGVGKTSLLVRFNEDHFIIDQKTTIGVDYKAKEILIDQERVKLQVRQQTLESINILQMHVSRRYGIQQDKRDFVR